MTLREILAAQRVGLGLSIPGGGAGAGLQHGTQELWVRIQSPGLGGERLLYHCRWATSGKAQSPCTHLVPELKAPHWQ